MQDIRHVALKNVPSNGINQLAAHRILQASCPFTHGTIPPESKMIEPCMDN